MLRIFTLGAAVRSVKGAYPPPGAGVSQTNAARCKLNLHSAGHIVPAARPLLRTAAASPALDGRPAGLPARRRLAARPRDERGNAAAQQRARLEPRVAGGKLSGRRQ